MKRMEFARVGVLGLACLGVGSAFAGCSVELEDGVEGAEAVSALSSDCRDPGRKVSETFTGGVSPKNTSPRTYSDCPDARLIQVNDYATQYYVGGHTVARWADTVPTNAEECRNIYITAALYRKDGSKWTQVVSKKAHGDYLGDNLKGDVVPPPLQPLKPVPPGSIVPQPPQIITPRPIAAALCAVPAVYFYGNEMEGGKTYRIAGSARTTHDSHTLRKFSIESLAGTCGQDALRCCTSGKECDNDLFCDANATCAPCGGRGEKCCANNSCDSDGLRCNGAVCVLCGGAGNRCCAGNKCNADLVCNGGAGTCESCGGSGERCCTGQTCDNSGLMCNGSTCKSCGGSGEPCCANETCDNTSLLCSSGGSCMACGGKDQPCCANKACGSGLACNSSNQCKTAPSAPDCGGITQACCGGSLCTSPLYCEATTKKCFTTPGLCDAPNKNCCGTTCDTKYFPNLQCNRGTGRCE